MRNFCLNIVTETVEERERNNFVRKDLMQYLIQLRNNSETNDADDWKINASGWLRYFKRLNSIAKDINSSMKAKQSRA